MGCVCVCGSIVEQIQRWPHVSLLVYDLVFVFLVRELPHVLRVHAPVVDANVRQATQQQLQLLALWVLRGTL